MYEDISILRQTAAFLRDIQFRVRECLKKHLSETKCAVAALTSTATMKKPVAKAS